MTTPITGQGLNVCIPPDDELSLTSKNAVQNKVIDEELSDVKNAISQKQAAPSSAGTAGQVLGLDNSLRPVWMNQSGGGDTVAEKLLADIIPGTTQTVTFDANSKPSTVVFSENGSAVRTDSFTWGTGTVTEVRTLSSGEYITMVTDLTTLVTTMSAIQRGA